MTGRRFYDEANRRLLKPLKLTNTIPQDGPRIKGSVLGDYLFIRNCRDLTGFVGSPSLACFLCPDPFYGGIGFIQIGEDRIDETQLVLIRQLLDLRKYFFGDFQHVIHLAQE